MYMCTGVYLYVSSKSKHKIKNTWILSFEDNGALILRNGHEIKVGLSICKQVSCGGRLLFQQRLKQRNFKTDKQNNLDNWAV